MSFPCPNCGYLIEEAAVESEYREGYEASQPVWILDSAVRCPGCEAGLGKSESNSAEHVVGWSFHQVSELAVVAEVAREEFDSVREKVRRYRSMAAELEELFRQVRQGDVLYRFQGPDGITGLALARHQAVIQTFLTLKSL